MFCKIGKLDKIKQQACRIVTIDDGHVWIYRPAGKIRRLGLLPTKNEKRFDRPKIIPVKLLCRKEVAEVPLVLASMKSNQFLARSTFVELKDSGTYEGNRAAIQAVTNDWETGFKVDPLDCLSSLEIETLVAKIFEAHNCYVPAYKGGYLKDVDLFASPRSDSNIGNLALKAKKKLSIQIKLALPNRDTQLEKWLENSRNILITLGGHNGKFINSKNVFTREWLRHAICGKAAVNSWFEETLSWLPKRKWKMRQAGRRP